MPSPDPSAVLHAALVVLLFGLVAAGTQRPLPTETPAAAAPRALVVAGAGEVTEVAAPAPVAVRRDRFAVATSSPRGAEATSRATPDVADTREPTSSPGLLPVVDPDTLRTLAARTGIPPRALQAYAAAHLRLREEQPGCHLDWTLLAAIGYVESAHGTHGGGHIDADGNTTRAVIGPALDGSPGVRAIRDTDGGALDRDLAWDRAVGPMQFIPSTWAQWGVDANGSGVADPHNIDDAALSAARYLCAGGGDLRRAEAWSRAVLRYNDSYDYLRYVLRVNNAYARASHR